MSGVINNFNLMDKVLIPESEDDFWFGQIIARRKDIPDLSRTDKWIKSYYIRDFDHLKKKESEIIKLCEVFHSRFYINPNVRNFTRVNLSLIKALVSNLENKCCSALSSQIDSVIGKCSPISGRQKIWIIDVDITEDAPTDVEALKKFINECSLFGDKIIVELPTKNGIHLLTKPFNKLEFADGLIHAENIWVSPDDIKTNSPTLIYYNDLL